MPSTTISAAEMRINERLNRLAEDEHWNITATLLKRIIREAGRAADMQRPVDDLQPGKSLAASAARMAALERFPAPVVAASGGCVLAGCTDSASGWRLYVHEGWRGVCSRHSGAAKALARRLNRDLDPGGPVLLSPPGGPVAAPGGPSAARKPHGGSPHPSGPSQGVTTPESDAVALAVLQRVAAGHTNTTIAADLNLTIPQVKYRVHAWLLASGQTYRGALGDWARKTGLLTAMEAGQ